MIKETNCFRDPPIFLQIKINILEQSETDCFIRVYQSYLLRAFKQAYLCPMQPFIFSISIPSVKLIAENTN